MKTYLSLGANLGAREATINQAVYLITQRAGTLIQRSAFFYSKPWGFQSEYEFCNLCISIETHLSPLELLHTLQRIEITLGRNRQETHAIGKRLYEDRPIDIDIIIYEGVTMNTPELTLPHPLYQQRNFVLIPLKELLT